MCVSYDSPNKQRVHSSRCWAVCIRSYLFNPDKPPSLGMGLQQPFLLPARSTCLLQPSVCVTDWFSGQSSPYPPSLTLSQSHTHTHTQWNFIIKHLFAYSWDSLKRFRRKALRGREPNVDVCRPLIKVFINTPFRYTTAPCVQWSRNGNVLISSSFSSFLFPFSSSVLLLLRLSPIKHFGLFWFGSNSKTVR